MGDTSALPGTGILPGENPVEQMVLIPDAPLELTNWMLPITLLSDEIVPEATKQLTDSIRRFGLLQPILIRKTTRMVTTTDGRDLPGIEYTVVDGRRRLDACRKIGIDPVPVVVAETDLAIADVATLATNATRTSNPVAEYDAIERLIRKGATIKDISGATGMSQQTIKARQRLFNLDPTLLDAFRAGTITVSVAEAAAKLPKAIQKDLAVAQFATGKLTMTDIHDARTARTQQAMALAEAFDFGAVEGTDQSRVIPDPPEFGQANRLAALADEIDPAQGTIIRSLRWCAAILMDIATGQRTIMVKPEELDLPPGDDIPITVRKMTPHELRDMPRTVGQRKKPSVFDQGSEPSSVGFAAHYAMGQGVPSDATPNEADVAQPNRVFTVTKIEEPEEEPEDMDTSDQEPYPAEQADDERYPGNWMNEVFER